MISTLGSMAAIVGIARALTFKDDPDLKSPLQLGAMAAVDAMRQAGIGRNQVGALFTARMPTAYRTLQYNQTLLNELKICPTFTSEITAHGAGAIGTLAYAVMAVNSGLIDYALCVTNEAATVWLGKAKTGSNAMIESNLQFEAPYGPITPALYAQIACRYMHEYGVTPEMTARVAVENRRWALAHPGAAMRKKGPLTIEDVLSSRMVASPLRLLDCSVNYPAGIGSAVVVTRADTARRDHVDPTWIAGFGQSNTHEWISERMGVWGAGPVDDEPNLTAIGVAAAARQAYDMAGIGPDDIDLVETSAPFTFANLMVIEDLGFCGKGEGGAFVADGGIAFDSGLPFNTRGGYLSFGQTAQGLDDLHEVVDQLWGRAEGRQVPEATIGLAHGHGGVLACHSVMILSKEPTR